MEIQPINQSRLDIGITASQDDTQLMEVAKNLEAAFLAEMLKTIGFGDTPESFGGGAGEDQFGSFLREEQAKRMTEAGGIGLAESLFDAMTDQHNE